ncbi:MAG: nucleotidyltransferase domain-containing protein [Nitrospirae bacterium]|nr:nucleotidyltransferase domain-containing protein [Nitrospirota bacterium]MBF0590887.1 nucleotidyltransferase domain-containing protein [Nitrospirota bacterium]
MGNDEIIAALRKYKRQFADQYGIISIGVFGSLARNEMRIDSDVDIVIEMDIPNIIKMSRIRLEIEELLQRHVDIVHYRERMNRLLKERIDSETIYV